MIKAIINDFAENCYILYDENDAYIIDPGSNYDAMKKFIQKQNLTLLGVLLTHGHYDHISGLNALLDDFSAPIYIHEAERDFLFDPTLNLSHMMAERFKLKEKHRIHTLEAGDIFALGKGKIHAFHTPGHTRGGMSFAYEDYLFTGDALFRETIGRTDLPTGDQPTLIKSVTRILSSFQPNTLIYPGHGQFTTVAHEKAFNPYVRTA